MDMKEVGEFAVIVFAVLVIYGLVSKYIPTGL